VFLGYDSPAHGEVLAGTAFFLGLKEGAASFVYLVTAAHVIEGLKERHYENMFIRLNSKTGGASRIEISVDSWLFHPTDARVDVAAREIPAWGDFDALPFPAEGAATPEVIALAGIGLGDEVFMVGLYTKHAGKGRNTPVVRIGNVAATPEEPCETKRGAMDGYLVEIRSIGGISGSPVFVRTPWAIWNRNMEPFRIDVNQYLLGLMHGRWDMKHLAPVMFEIDADYLKQPLNSGIGVVVPVARILEVLARPEFVAGRARRLEELKELGATSTDSSEPQ
jgi:hypothetical protein